MPTTENGERWSTEVVNELIDSAIATPRTLTSQPGPELLKRRAAKVFGGERHPCGLIVILVRHGGGG